MRSKTRSSSQSQPFTTAPEPGQPIFDRSRLRPVAPPPSPPPANLSPPTSGDGHHPSRRPDTIRVISRAEKDEYLWLKNRVGALMTVLFYSGSRWEHCRFRKLHTFSLVMDDPHGTECLLFKHSIAALIPEEDVDQYQSGRRP